MQAGLSQQVQSFLSNLANEPLLDIKPVLGGDSAQAYKVSFASKSFFLKMMKGENALEILQAERDGLSALAEASKANIPDVVAFKAHDDGGLLVLPFIQKGKETPAFWKNLAQGLASIHSISADAFGWLISDQARSNYIGPLVQFNNRHLTFASFYISERLNPQVQLALRQGLLSPQLGNTFERLYKEIPNLIPEEGPRLIHGDLWKGNVLADEKEQAWFIDPSVSYCHREMDLGMSLLFGGFSEVFYKAYHDFLPLEPGWEERMPYYQLYYLLVHLNLFGTAYLPAVKRIITGF